MGYYSTASIFYFQCPSCPETMEKSDLEELICDASAGRYLLTKVL